MEYIIFLFAQSLWWGIVSWKFFAAAGRKSWEAFVPFYNMYVMLKIAERPTWWIILLLLPVIGTVMNVVLVYEFLHVYGQRKTWQTAAVLLTVGIYLGFMNYFEPIKYVGRDAKAIKAAIGDWGNSIFFAIVAATIIRATTFEAYTIPTSSMEKSLMVGDFLFVSKIHYGVRIPMTPISFPLVHNMLPFSTIKSYLEHPQIPYIRLPKIHAVKRGESVVFNYPVDGDPIDKKTNYIKRCVGIPGDDIEVKDRVLYVNGEVFQFPDRANPQYKYYVRTNGMSFNRDQLKRDFDINFLSMAEYRRDPSSQDVYALQNGKNEYLIFVSDSVYENFSKLSNIEEIKPIIAPRAGEIITAELPETLKLLNYSDTSAVLFPDASVHSNRFFEYSWDNYGPLHIPAEGDVIELNPKNILQYATVIEKYEGNTVRIENGAYFINDVQANSYTIKQNYYWMMGDNRHNSQDSRYWGYVPEDHIVGKPVFIWMSWDKNGKGLDKIRFERIFTTVHGEGKRVGYFWYALIIGLIIYGANKYRLKRKAA